MTIPSLPFTSIDSIFFTRLLARISKSIVLIETIKFFTESQLNAICVGNATDRDWSIYIVNLDSLFKRLENRLFEDL